MKTTVLIIHCAGVRSFKVMSEKWVPFVQNALGKEYKVIAPAMPTPQVPQYSRWKETISTTLSTISGPIALVGHSLVWNYSKKYITEKKSDMTFLVYI